MNDHREKYLQQKMRTTETMQATVALPGTT